MNILDVPMQENDADAKTIREYLVKLLLELWREGEGFSGKRPFGNSNWEYEIYDALGRSGAVKATINAWDEVTLADYPAADALVAEAIRSLGGDR